MKGGQRMKKMQKSTAGAGMIKATEQMQSKKSGGKVETGKDLRQKPTGGSKAKGSM